MNDDRQSKATDPTPTVRWRPSLGRMMFGVAIVAPFLAEESRLILFGATYFLYPIAMIWMVVTKRHRRVARNRPLSWRLAWVALAGMFLGWPMLFIIPNIPDDGPAMRFAFTISKVLVWTPVAFAALVAWLLIPLPRMERSRP